MEEKVIPAVKVIADSVNTSGNRITTLELRYWRGIHAEIMTHRDRARNAASSRAIPFYREKDGVPVENCTYTQIKEGAFFPKYIGGEQKGMQSGDELPEPTRSDAIEIIEQMRDYCLSRCMELFEMGVHKSIINRYLEPWSYITVVMTATCWKNFFRLRVHPKAEKHFNELASDIQYALEASQPAPLSDGLWHLPYIREEDYEDVQRQALNLAEIKEVNTTQILKRVSAARCARVSYLTHDGQRSLNADLDLFRTLIHPKKEDGTPDDVIHASPLEHVAQAAPFELQSGPFTGWYQFRKEFANESVPG